MSQVGNYKRLSLGVTHEEIRLQKRKPPLRYPFEDQDRAPISIPQLLEKVGCSQSNTLGPLEESALLAQEVSTWRLGKLSGYSI